ncbi:MAG: hypothetical protein AAF483_06685 [Planctomycetota bacterium]
MWNPVGYCYLMRLCNRRVVVLVLTFPLLLLGFRWLAIHFTFSEYESAWQKAWQKVEWESETILKIRHDFYEGNYRWPSRVIREYRLDCETGSMEFVSRQFDEGGLSGGVPSLYDEIPGSDCTIARLPYGQAASIIEQLGIPKHRRLTPDVELLLLFDSKKQEISRWEAPADAELGLTEGIIATVDLDAAQIIARDAATGTILSSIPIQQARAPSELRWDTYGSVLRFYDERQTLSAFELRSGRKLPISGSWNGLVLGIWEDECLIIQDRFYALYPVNWPPTLEVRSIDTGQVLSSFEFPPTCGFSHDAIRYSVDGSQVIFVGWDDIVHYVDKESGEIVRRVNLRAGHRWIIGLLVAGITAWVILLLRICSELNTSNLLRSVLLTAAIICFLAMRLALSGHHGNHSRLAWQVLIALAIVWGIGLTFYSAAQHRLSWQRFRLPTAYLLLVYLVAINQCTSFYLESLVVQTSASVALLMLPVLIFYKHPKGREKPSRLESGRSFSLTMLFEWIVFGAALMTCVMSTNPDIAQYLTSLRISDAFTGAALMTVVVFITFLLLRRHKRSILLRGLAILFVAVAAGCFHLAWDVHLQYSNFIDSVDFINAARPMLAAAILTVVGFMNSNSGTGGASIQSTTI